MAKKKKPENSPSILKIGAVFILSLIIGVIFYFQIAQFLKKSNYFKIKVVKRDETLEFISARDLESLIGNNIFSISLRKIEQKLSQKYPEASELKVVRRFPNQIEIVARKRVAFAQTTFHEKVLTLDEQGILLSTTAKPADNLPSIAGLNISSARLTLGLPLNAENVQAAVSILKIFKQYNVSVSHYVRKINIENPSKIYLEMSNGLEVIVDTDNVERKMKILNLVLSEGRIDVKEVKYIDLRFKEPILGKK